MAIDGWELIDAWFKLYMPYPLESIDIESGLRKGLPSSGYIEYPGGVKQEIQKGNLQTGACQYYIQGMPSICSYWSNTLFKCVFPVSAEGRPSGYGTGSCDMLGRRGWCSKYEASKEFDPNERSCVVPCVERSGLGHQIIKDEFVSFDAILPKDIKGYNPRDDGSGECDGLGLGRGTVYEKIEDAWPHPIKCGYFRPQAMGFGAFQPRPYHGATKPGEQFDYSKHTIPNELEDLHDGSPADPFSDMSPRLPFAFQVYNHRAMYQKCSYWDSPLPAFFDLSYWGDNPYDVQIELEGDPLATCVCPHDDLVTPFREIKGDWDTTVPAMLQKVWAGYGGIVCNGAKPECPCYTGKFIFCNDANMHDGMRISADQILELRFWVSNWYDQDDYDSFYAEKPGVTTNGYADETTSDIYTFTKWKQDPTLDQNTKVMEGWRTWLCVPAPLHMREFVPKVYIRQEYIDYPPVSAYTGTNVEGGGVLFPTLVRELPPISDYVPEITVIYPYETEDPWSIVPCEDNDTKNPCVHDFNLMEAPFISVVGHGVMRSEVYVINSNLSPNIDKARRYMDDYKRTSKIPADKLLDFNSAMEDAVTVCWEANVGLSIGTTSDTGLFHVSNVELELNALNHLYIFCSYQHPLGGASYVFLNINVDNRFWGALITQPNMTAPYQPLNPFPDYYNGQVSIGGVVNAVRGEVNEVIGVTSVKHWSNTGMTYTYYSYCVNEIEETVEDLEKWVQIGPTGYIWLEIDNIDLNYDFPFTMLEATLEYTPPTDSEGKAKQTVINMCDNDPGTPIELELVFPKLYGSGDYAKMRRTIPPNALILKAPEPMALFNSDWKLTLKYAYHQFDTALGDKVVFPLSIDSPMSENVFAPCKYTVEHSRGSASFTIPRIGSIFSASTAKVIAFLTDDNGRVQVSAASKMLFQGHRLGCRSVDIFYKYSADAQWWNIEPSSGFYTWRGAPKATSKRVRHGKIANCGDHECGDPCRGPMWFPFNRCDIDDFYNVINPANQCTGRIIEGLHTAAAMGLGGERYGMAPIYQSYVSLGGNWLSPCSADYFYHYSEARADTMVFSGFGYKKAKIDRFYYNFRGWHQPPFGNLGRGAVERFLSREYTSFIDFSYSPAKTVYEYMPLVFDIEDLTQELNCFATPDQYGPAKDIFTCFPMLSNYVFTTLGEEVTEDRSKFEDIIEVVYHANCMYPFPWYNTPGLPAVARYAFKDESIVWAWPEYWKPVERRINDNQEKLNFIELELPPYQFGIVKDENRLVTSEGEHILVFEPPKEGSGGGKATGAKAFPSISLDNEHPRFFNIIYDDYDSQQVEWQDEAETGEAGASGGSGGGSGQIYELANNDSRFGPMPAGGTIWLHDFDTIFDADASAEKSEDRKVWIAVDLDGEKVYGYYNRGLIARIYRNRLNFLPMSVEPIGSGNSVSPDASNIAEIYENLGFGVAAVEVTINGLWGVDPSTDPEVDDVIVSKPAVVLYESENTLVTDDTNFPLAEGGSTVGGSVAASGSEITERQLVDYTIVMTLPRTPTRFTTNLSYFFVKLSAMGNEVLIVDSVVVKVGKYVRTEETIQVWERRFRTSKIELAEGILNADGPESKTLRDYDRNKKNAGQYFPFNQDIEIKDENLEGDIFVASKTNMVSCTEVVYEDEEIPITIEDLKYWENQAQQELYEEAFNLDGLDELDYAGICPPAIAGWIEEHNIPLNHADAMKLTHVKTPWEETSHKLALRQKGEFWQPGGHYYIWGEETFKARCYMFGGVQTIYDVVFVHHLHGGSQKTFDPGHSFQGWGRLAFLTGKFNNLSGMGIFRDGQVFAGGMNAARGNTPYESR